MSLEASLAKSYPPNGASPGFSLDVQLKCEAGVTILFGASGAGKTLTLDSLAGLVRPERGRILLGGEILFDAQRGVHVPPRARGVGYVFQNEALFPHMTVEENLLFPLKRLGPLERRRRARSMLERFRLGALASRYPRELSGGEKQRASIARALVTEPRLLLLDEPARGLDFELRSDFYRVVREVRAQYHIPILMVTHDIVESFTLAERMLIYNQGRVVQEGSPEDVFRRPRDRSVAHLLGFTNVFEAAIEALDPAAGTARVRTPDFAVTVAYLPGRLLGDRVGFCIAPQHVRLLPDSVSAGAGDNLLEAELLDHNFTPTAARLFLRPVGSGVELQCEITRAEFQERNVAGQKRWTLALPPAAIHVFQGS